MSHNATGRLTLYFLRADYRCEPAFFFKWFIGKALGLAIAWFVLDYGVAASDLIEAAKPVQTRLVSSETATFAIVFGILLVLVLQSWDSLRLLIKREAELAKLRLLGFSGGSLALILFLEQLGFLLAALLLIYLGFWLTETLTGSLILSRHPNSALTLRKNLLVLAILNLFSMVGPLIGLVVWRWRSHRAALQLIRGE